MGGRREFGRNETGRREEIEGGRESEGGEGSTHTSNGPQFYGRMSE